MSFARVYEEREELTPEHNQGLVLVEFGADWCPICQAFQADLEKALQSVPGAYRHVKVQDGKGKPLGRRYQVKLWPNLVFLREGQIVTQLARPSSDELLAALQGWSG